MIFGRESHKKADGIIVGLRRHDPEAIGDLYDLAGRKVYSAIFAIVRDPLVAENLLQDTFVCAWTQAQDLAGDATDLTAWLLSAGRRRAVEYLRASRRRGDESAAQADAATDQAGQTKGVRDVILRMPRQQRKVIEMLYYDGLSPTEIAERLHEPLGAVKGLARMAMERLRGIEKTRGLSA